MRKIPESADPPASAEQSPGCVDSKNSLCCAIFTAHALIFKQHNELFEGFSSHTFLSCDSENETVLGTSFVYEHM